MVYNQIKETAIYVKDLRISEEFYCGKLGLELIGKSAGRHIFLRAGTSILLCFIASATTEDKVLPPHGGYGQIHFALETPQENYQAAKEELISKGISIIHEQTWKNGVNSFYFRDPDGHLVEIVTPVLWI